MVRRLVVFRMHREGFATEDRAGNHSVAKPDNLVVKALLTISGAWTRGDRLDHDDWAREIGDERWSYDGLLPYYCKSEHHHDSWADPAQHGFEGPVHTASVSSSEREYPLRDTVRKMWQSLGLPYKHDLNDGSPQSVSDLVENWRDGKRQLASSAYRLDGVDVRLETTVRRVVLNEENVAVGVELVSGEVLKLNEGGQVIVSAGTYRTPQVLMLSGIGDPAHLRDHGIDVKVALPAVGRNLHDHLLFYRYWKLRHPELGLALGSPKFAGPNFEKGGPIDFLVRAPVASEGLRAAIAKDEGKDVADDHELLTGPRTHLELSVLYGPLGAEAQGLSLPIDGTSIGTFFMTCLPTSRGSVTLPSADPADAPIIDPNYAATEADRYVLREGFRMLSKVVLDTQHGKAMVIAEHTPPGFPDLGLDASDELINERVRMGARSTFHPAGTAAMGSVVDGSLKIYGVPNLRVVDASVVSLEQERWISNLNTSDADHMYRFRSRSLRITRRLYTVRFPNIRQDISANASKQLRNKLQTSYTTSGVWLDVT
jgi:choline dehydrogenase-like flavoprotein